MFSCSYPRLDGINTAALTDVECGAMSQTDQTRQHRMHGALLVACSNDPVPVYQRVKSATGQVHVQLLQDSLKCLRRRFAAGFALLASSGGLRVEVEMSNAEKTFSGNFCESLLASSPGGARVQGIGKSAGMARFLLAFAGDCSGGCRKSSPPSPERQVLQISKLQICKSSVQPLAGQDARFVPLARPSHSRHAAVREPIRKP